MTNPELTPSGKLFVLNKGLIYIGEKIAPLFTRRQACVLVFSIDDAPIEVVIDDEAARIKTVLTGKAIALAQNIRRSVKVNGSGAIFVNFDPAHPIHYCLFKWLGNRPANIIEPSFERIFLSMIERFLIDKTSIASRIMFDDIVNLTGIMCKERARDNRVSDLVEKIYYDAPDDYRFDQFIKKTKLSPSRLSHLFSENTGLSIRSVMQWRKIREAIILFAGGANLTRVAHEAGFSDSAHFCKTFKACLGVNPSHFVGKNTISINLVEH